MSKSESISESTIAEMAATLLSGFAINRGPDFAETDVRDAVAVARLIVAEVPADAPAGAGDD
jgi:hypothetical protein